MAQNERITLDSIIGAQNQGVIPTRDSIFVAMIDLALGEGAHLTPNLVSLLAYNCGLNQEQASEILSQPLSEHIINGRQVEVERDGSLYAQGIPLNDLETQEIIIDVIRVAREGGVVPSSLSALSTSEDGTSVDVANQDMQEATPLLNQEQATGDNGLIPQPQTPEEPHGPTPTPPRRLRKDEDAQPSHSTARQVDTDKANIKPAERSGDVLYPRERQVYDLITADEFTRAEIAKQLGISLGGVHSYFSAACKKLGTPAKASSPSRASNWATNASRSDGPEPEPRSDSPHVSLVGERQQAGYAFRHAPIYEALHEEDPSSPLIGKEVHHFLRLLKSDSGAVQDIISIPFSAFPWIIAHDLDKVLDTTIKIDPSFDRPLLSDELSGDEYDKVLVERVLMYLKIENYNIRAQALQVPESVRQEAMNVINWLHEEWKKSHPPAPQFISQIAS